MEYREYIEQFKHLGYEGYIFYPDEDKTYGKVFSSFFTFCRDNIDHDMWKGLDIKPCYFFFEKADDCNAVAEELLTGEKVIGINKGLVIAFNDIFTDLDPVIEALPETKILRQIGLDTPAYYLMFQACTMFIYYHELGHIIQFSGAERKKFQEKRMAAAGNFNILDHASEFDSDEFATNFTFEHIKYYWEKIPAEKRSLEATEALLTINIVALFILFDLIAGKISLPLYYEESDHPHEVIRITAMVGIFLGRFSDYVSIDGSSDRILKRAFEILKIVLPENKSLDEFFTAIKSDKNEIAAYSSKILEVRNRYDCTYKLS
jgi:hypothetical protein